jgi:uncharacterized delta-60 repeat protein
MKRVWILAVLVLAAGWARAASMVDPTFTTGSGANGIVEQVLMQPDGKVLICGNFTSFNGADRPYCARLNSDGSVDLSFNPRPSYWTRHMALQADGKIVICGYFKNVGGVNRNLIARVNADGTIDTTFNPGAGAETLIAPGIDGGVDPFVFWVEIQTDGKIVATGNFRTYDGASSVGIVRINSNGSRDTSFVVGQGLDSWGRVIKILANGQILVGGWFTSYNGSGGHRLVRINSNGTRDASLNPFYGDKTAVYSIGVQPDGRLITSGHSENVDRIFIQDIARLNADGSFDQSFVGNANEKTECVLVQRDGKIILVGYFNLVNGVPRRGIARLNADGTLDPTFVAEADNYVWTVTSGPTGKIYVSGGFTTIDGIPRGGVARLTLPGTSTSTNTPPPAPSIANARVVNGRFECAINTAANYTYVLQYKTGATGTTWTSLPSVTGNGSQMTLTDPSVSGTRFYRVEAR